MISIEKFMNLKRKGMRRVPKKLNTTTIKRLFAYMLRYPVRLVIVIIAIIFGSVATAAASLFLRSLIDDYISPLLLDSNPVYDGLIRALTIMAFIYSVGVISTLLYNRLMVDIAQGVLKTIRDDMFEDMQKLPISYFDQHSHGDLMSHFTNDTDTLRQMLTQSLPQLFSSLITIISVFFSMLYLSVWLTVFSVIVIAISMRLARLLVGKSRKYFQEQQKAIGDVNGYIEEMIGGLKVVKVFNYEHESKKVFDHKNEALNVAASNANGYANVLMPLMNNIGYVLYVLIALIGGYMAINQVTNLSLVGLNVFTLGTIASFLQLSRSFVQPIAQVSQQVNAVIMALAGAERIFDLMDQEPEGDDGIVMLVKKDGGWAWEYPQEDGSKSYTPLKGEVEFDHVDFGYTHDELVLHDIVMDAKAGEKIALVGSTGAGKTTITNLINRFYEIKSGHIRYDGIEITKIKKSALRQSLGIVLQDVNLFSGTVMDNIRYGRLDATDEECIDAAKLANAHHFIEMLSDGYETQLSAGGGSLSQGQRQLLSIARAAVADPPVMILDEATSSIDTRTEKIVQEGMDALMKGRTVFVIAHRLSTIQNSDEIVVLEHGRIIEQGNHEELIKQHGEYYQLYTGALELS